VLAYFSFDNPIKRTDMLLSAVLINEARAVELKRSQGSS